MVVSKFEDLDLSRQYTYADYITWNFQERVELLRGWVAKMSPAPNRMHQRIAGNFHGEMHTYFRDESCQLYSAPFDVRLPRSVGGESVVQPDICVICDEDKLTDQGVNGAPDWVIEVLSPGNSKREMRDKYDLYEEAGVREYWLVQPLEEVVLRFVLEGGKFIGLAPLTSDDMLVSAIFPTIKLDGARIFSA